MLPRRVVNQVLYAGERSETIDRGLRARNAAVQAEATELRLDASTLEKARDSLVSASRAVLAHPADGGFRYLVFDAALAKLSNYFFYIKAWAQTPDGQWYLHVRQRDCTWRPIDLDGEAGPPAISRAASEADMQCPIPAPNTYSHLRRGRLVVLLKVLSQVGGCPAEFEDASDDAIDSRFR